MAVIFWLFIVNSELITLMISDNTKEIEKVTSEFFPGPYHVVFFIFSNIVYIFVDMVAYPRMTR